MTSAPRLATPTEAAAFGVVAAFILAALNRSVDAHMVKQVMLTTVRTSSMIMLIVTSAFILSFALAILGVPAQLTAMVSQWNLTPLTFVFSTIGIRGPAVDVGPIAPGSVGVYSGARGRQRDETLGAIHSTAAARHPRARPR